MNRLLSIGEKFPEFLLPACVSTDMGKEFETITSERLRGRWNVLFFWPLDFTSVCPTEIMEFSRAIDQFRNRETHVYGLSTDSHFVHLAWRNSHPGLKNLGFPMLADHKRELSESLGVLHPKEKVPCRATFIVDPEGTIRWVSVNDLAVGRNVKEVLRTLDALRSGEMCPCNWEKGQPTLKR